MSEPILPGATLGVLGGGQLGRMFTIAARRLGYRVHVLSPEDDTPTGQVADLEIKADYLDLEAIARFAKGVSVVTFEFENVPAATAQTAALHVPVRPDGSVLHTTQNRLREKTFLRDNGIPVTGFAHVRTRAELSAAIAQLGLPAVLKTAAWGYDGKGQAMIRKAEDADVAWTQLRTTDAILEAFVDFDIEVSVVTARGVDGSFAHFGAVHNTHHHHILDVTIAPAQVSAQVAREAVEIARAIVEKLQVVGVLCVEFFLTKSGKLLVNELAPRPHNSGHFSIDACVTCQFEQQVRAVAGLPLGSTRQFAPAAMANLLGDVWVAAGGTPRWTKMAEMGDVKLHLYGKRDARPGRKMGHLTAVAATAEQAAERVRAARAALVS